MAPRNLGGKGRMRREMLRVSLFYRKGNQGSFAIPRFWVGRASPRAEEANGWGWIGFRGSRGRSPHPLFAEALPSFVTQVLHERRAAPPAYHEIYENEDPA